MKIQILQIGSRDWTSAYTYPKEISIVHTDSVVLSNDIYEIVILERNLTREEADKIYEMSYSYCLFVVDSVDMDSNTRQLFDRRMGQVLVASDIEKFLNEDAKYYFTYINSEKYNHQEISISRGFKGKINWQGNYSLSLNGDFGAQFNQAAFWRNNIILEENQAIEFWLEYKKDAGVEISFSVKQFLSDTISDLINSWEFSEEDLKQPVVILGDKGKGPIFCSVNAMGSGRLDIISLHARVSRIDKGTFLVGGQRHVTSDREEIFSYFDPGDMKPPLAVYFSGYKKKEGFEGYKMMRKLGCPFLLISEQRFEGGGGYLGSEEFEATIVKIIETYMNKLGFFQDQLILSGISIGAVGAMYYGCDLRPYALLIGKPLASLGDVAANERLKRPQGFPTSLDLLQHFAGSLDETAVEKMNKRFWDKLKSASFGNTKFIVSYMFEDDYDATAYEKLISEMNSYGVQIYGKGLHGRHNDNTEGIVAWFKGQYERIVKENFSR
ncbi:accessory secretory protein Asp2 [Pseudobutyrivibrio sp. OR37]|uniref:accessory Sec system protein Asp2 n=1 Tax=Pseudobutyrivibrio sp. OR37 TaxID=1798186 RepID=UPI0008E3B027|nr:accessory Sec system protein Asp2 [Pseudobutyrivibrio sp. OR37]SFH97589.1 accessory secretory protein Asp2 [Pseudobutyrivibrio sp. OR37]